MLAGLRERGYDDLVPAHLSVMRYPGPENMRPSNLAERTGMTRQALKYLLGQMEERGYIERVHEEDQRFKRIHLTARGVALGEAMREIVRGLEAEWAERLGAERFAVLRELLESLDLTGDPGRGSASGDSGE